MTDEPKHVMDLIKEIHLFEGLDERQIARIAARTRIVPLDVEESLPFEDLDEDEDYPFYVVQSGKVRLTPPRWKSKIDEILRHGDFFGADTLFFGSRPDYQVTALTPALLLRIESDILADLLVDIQILKGNLKDAVNIYRQIHGRHFEWLGEDEVVRMIRRKHPAYLLVSLVLPLLLGWLAVLLFIAGSFIDAGFFRGASEWAAVIVLVAAGLWAGWAYIDWRNDYYIVSDRRVVWLEHVVGLYDSRQEAPLTAIKSEEVQSTLLGRYLGYGDVIVHTLMGKITFDDIGAPEEVRETIIEQQLLAEEREHQANIQAMEELIRQKIEPIPEEMEETEEQVEITEQEREVPVTAQPSPLLRAITNIFKTRIEENGVVTYRKHFYILIRKVFLPSLLILLLLSLLIYLFSQGISGSIILIVSLVVYIGLSLWWLYQFVDWRNDIYRLTFDKVIDSERKPLGSEVTKSAYLDNILSLDYQRLGLLGILLNFGNVIINVGTEHKFVFRHIYNPARAQQDIFNRMYANRRARERAEAAEEREHMADLFAAYDRQLRGENNNQNFPNLEGDSG